MNDWMNELKEGSSKPNLDIGDTGGSPAGLKGGSAKNPPGYFTGHFKFQVGEKVRSRIHEANGIIEYSEMTRFITSDQISYKIRFNNEEDLKTETSMVDEAWLEKI